MYPLDITYGSVPAEALVAAYRRGIFPMAVPGHDKMVGWFAPDPRSVVDLAAPHIPRSLRKAVRKAPFEITVDAAPVRVFDACAGLDGPGRPGSWMTKTLRAAFLPLIETGHLHSIEVWTPEGDFAGGLYGLKFGGAFFGESMVALKPDASKIAFVHLLARLRAGGFTLLDSQMRTEHMARFGLIDLPGAQFGAALADALTTSATWTPCRDAVDRELADLVGPRRSSDYQTPPTADHITQAAS